jgi:hypothetical protein
MTTIYIAYLIAFLFFVGVFYIRQPLLHTVAEALRYSKTAMQLLNDSTSTTDLVYPDQMKTSIMVLFQRTVPMANKMTIAVLSGAALSVLGIAVTYFGADSLIIPTQLAISGAAAYIIVTWKKNQLYTTAAALLVALVSIIEMNVIVKRLQRFTELRATELTDEQIIGYLRREAPTGGAVMFFSDSQLLEEWHGESMKSMDASIKAELVARTRDLSEIKARYEETYTGMMKYIDLQ